MSKLNDRLNSVKFDRIVFFGRTLSEYVKFFDLNLEEWKNSKILDCPCGAASFVAEANQRGISAVGCDSLFALAQIELMERGKVDIDHVIDQLSPITHLFNWDFYQSLDGLKEYRTKAFNTFANDYTQGIIEHRYIQAELPKLPFADGSFDLVLSGHFLFTYSYELDYTFHLNALLEMQRVSRNQVRVYPIQDADSQPYKYMEQLCDDLNHQGIHTQIINVPWEFKKGCNQMLTLSRD